MCACKQKKSFFIEDILKDVKKKPYKNLSHEPTKPLVCSKNDAPKKDEPIKFNIPKDKEPQFNKYKVKDDEFNTENHPYDYEVTKYSNKASDDVLKKYNTEHITVDAKFNNEHTSFKQTDHGLDKLQKYEKHVISVQNEIEFSNVLKKYNTEHITADAKFNNEHTSFKQTDHGLDKLQKYDKHLTSVQNEIEFRKISLEHRRNTYPLYPMPIKANLSWQHKKDPMYNGIRLEPRQFSYYSDPMLNTGLLRNQLALNRFVTHPYTIRQAYGFDRVPPNCCSPWWGLGGRRKGGQVRFTAAQTGALERRFNASKYLSPDERRALATTLRLSDRQVKTWFQNRRAKWRRTTPESADAGSPPTADEGSDDEIHRVDDD
ncbi:hypothetical protein K1T71_012386 [Dendrolimus kikuchii]|uniref:Uncharacterized protein n=1 Tax=Dendrolimus kikuchii TaxID=765133 RepID=A0ACC1CLG1_9NEOP|nr:hypothetical protein K1T71_012386 [Dendrolimus kikuchii]